LEISCVRLRGGWPPGGGEEFLGATRLPPGAAGERGGGQGGQGQFCSADNPRPDLCAELGGGGEKEDRVDHELAVDKHIAKEDQARGQDPTMEANHEHCRDV